MPILLDLDMVLIITGGCSQGGGEGGREVIVKGRRWIT
jgi:hypothetical protein